MKFIYIMKKYSVHVVDPSLELLHIIKKEQMMIFEDVLNEEIKLWEIFEYALREENSLLFHKMLDECKENQDYVKAAGFKDEFFPAESLFMVLILQQQKMINELISKVSEQKKKIREVNGMDVSKYLK